jgi:phage terminase large subunit-like protein
MTREEYINTFFDSALKYEEDILAGRVVACEWIGLAVKRRREYVEHKYTFSEDAVKRVFGFMYYINISHKGKKIPFMPMPWQAWVMMNLFGYYRDKDMKKRLYRFAQIWIGRKNSKTTFAAIMALYAFMKEERSPEAYIVATTKDQASQALRYLKQIVKDSPALNKRVRIMQYQLRHTINGTGYCRALANEPDKLDGLSPSFAIVDEKHEMPTNDLFNVMKTGTLARENPLIVTGKCTGLHHVKQVIRWHLMFFINNSK